MATGPDDRMKHREQEIAARIASLVEDAETEIDSIAAELTALYRESIPVYDQVARDEIERNTRSVLDIVVSQVRSDSFSLDTAMLTQLVRRWSDQKIPLELVAHSIQVGARRLSTIIRARASTRGLSSDVVDDIHDMMWHWATAYSAAVNAVMQENAVSRAERRSTFLRRLVEGTHSPTSLASLLAENNIDPAHRYSVAVADSDDTRLTSDVRATLRIRCAGSGLPVFDAVVDSRYVALLPTIPADLDFELLIAMGPAQLPVDAPSSYRISRETFDIASRFGRTGPVHPASLGPLPLLTVHDDIADILGSAHLTPVRERGDAGREILDTVSAFVKNNRRVDDTAAQLFLHRNTVRNRVAKFTELTGLDLEVTDHLVLTWWLLGRSERTDEAPSAGN